MHQDPEFSVHDTRVRAAVAQRAERLVESINSGKLPLSDEAEAAVRARIGAADFDRTEFDALAELLRDDDPQIREEVALCILLHAQQSHPPASPGWETWFFREESIQALLDGLDNANPRVRVILLRAFPVLKFGQPADVLPLLRKALSSEHGDVRIAALGANEALGRDWASKNFEQVAELAGDPDDEVRSEVYALLTRMGPDAISAVQCLSFRVVAEDDRDLKRHAARAVLHADPQAVELSKIRDPQCRAALVHELSELGEPARELRRRLPGIWKEFDTEYSKYVLMNKEDIGLYLGRTATTIKRWMDQGRLAHHGTEGEGRGLLYAMDPEELRQQKEFLSD